jgi:hypothetical protein
MSYTPIIQHITPIIQQYSTGYLHAFVLGSSLGYALPNGFYHHVPLIFLNPIAYASYQTFVSQSQVIAWTKELLK